MRLLPLLIASVLISPAIGCPLCSSETAREVRAELVDEHLGVSLLATVAPFAVVFGAVAVFHFLPSLPRRK